MKKLMLLLAAVAMSVTAGQQASGGVMVTATEYVGGNTVVFAFSGSLDTSGLSHSTGSRGSSQIRPSTALFFLGPNATVDIYTPLTTAPAFGTSLHALATDSTGDSFGVGVYRVWLPQGYLSGDLLSGSSTFTGTFASLGITPGSYVYTLGTGTNDNLITLETTSVSAVPEPTSLAVFGLLGLTVCGVRRRPSNRTT